jgi:chromate transporter
VRRRRWLAHERFLDLLGAANLIPGPSSTELAVYIGYEQAGWRGLILGGTCFILPAALMVGLIACAYVRFATLPQLAGALYGINRVVIVVVVQALWGLTPNEGQERHLSACSLSSSEMRPLLRLAWSPRRPDRPPTRPFAAGLVTKHRENLWSRD